MKNSEIKKIILHVICFILIISFTGCSFFFTVDKKEAGRDKIAISQPLLDINRPNTNDDTVTDTQVDEIEPTETITIEEKILYDDNGILIKVVEQNIGESIFGPQVRLYMENNSDQLVAIQVRDVSINGIMMDGLISSEIQPGKKAYDSVSFMDIDFTRSNIEKIASIELSFHVFDPETWSTLYKSPMVTIDTSALSTTTQEFDDTGDLIFQGEGIKILTQGIDYSDDIYGPSIKLYIENNSELAVTIQALDFSVNGYVFSPIFSCDITPNKIAYSYITIMESDLDEIGISDITDVEFRFHVYEPSTWDTIIDSEIISLTFK